MNRRKFTQLSSLFGLSIVLPMSGCSNNNYSLDDILSFPLTLSYFMAYEEINNIGLIYITKSSDEIHKKTIQDLLLHNIDINPNSFEPTKLIDDLLIKIKNDFKSNRTLEINGWVLSETEVQQCAFLTLIN